jgi:hypothetical protein
VHQVLARRNATRLRGEELLFSDAGAVKVARSPAGEAATPTRQHTPNAGLAEVTSGIQGIVLLVTVSSRPAFGRLT